MELEAPHVIVRDLDVNDLEAMAEAWTATDVPGFMDDVGPRKPEEVAAWLSEAIAARASNPGYGGCAIVERSSKHVVGWIGWGGSNERHREIGEIDFAYVVAPRFRRRGYATEALAAVVDYCFAQLRVGSVWGRCHADNAASRRVMEKAGLQPIGDVDGEPAYRVTRPATSSG